jgi:hypothetical protein
MATCLTPCFLAAKYAVDEINANLTHKRLLTEFGSYCWPAVMGDAPPAYCLLTLRPGGSVFASVTMSGQEYKDGQFCKSPRRQEPSIQMLLQVEAMVSLMESTNITTC